MEVGDEQADGPAAASSGAGTDPAHYAGSATARTRDRGQDRRRAGRHCAEARLPVTPTGPDGARLLAPGRRVASQPLEYSWCGQSIVLRHTGRMSTRCLPAWSTSTSPRSPQTVPAGSPSSARRPDHRRRPRPPVRSPRTRPGPVVNTVDGCVASVCRVQIATQLATSTRPRQLQHWGSGRARTPILGHVRDLACVRERLDMCGSTVSVEDR